MSLLAIMVLSALKGPSKGFAGIWATPEKSLMQVELQLMPNGRFQAEEFWTGEETKPMPHVKMKGYWELRPNFVALHANRIDARFGEILPKEKRLPVRTGRLVWIDQLGHDLQLTKTRRKPRQIVFSPMRAIGGSRAGG